jgi:hypothetical protein
VAQFWLSIALTKLAKLDRTEFVICVPVPEAIAALDQFITY